MPKPTRTTIAVAIAFVAVAAYGAYVAALLDSMYDELVALPHVDMVMTSIFTTIFAAVGLVHLVWTRGAPWHSLCLFLLFADMVCCCVLLGYAINAIPLTMIAIERASERTTYQHRMEAFFASDAGRQYHYWDTLFHSGRYMPTLPSNPMPYSYNDLYPKKAASAFEDAYCASEGHRFCSAFPLAQTIVYSGMWPNPNVTAEIARTLSTLPTTFLDVPVTATTTIDSFCAAVNLTETRSNVSTLDMVAVQRTDEFNKDLSIICQGCAVLSNITTEFNALRSWIHATCPMDVPKATGAHCVASARCAEYKIKTGGSICPSAWSMIYDTYMNPSNDACFGHTLMMSTHLSTSWRLRLPRALSFSSCCSSLRVSGCSTAPRIPASPCARSSYKRPSTTHNR